MRCGWDVELQEWMSSSWWVVHGLKVEPDGCVVACGRAPRCKIGLATQLGWIEETGSQAICCMPSSVVMFDCRGCGTFSLLSSYFLVLARLFFFFFLYC